MPVKILTKEHQILVILSYLITTVKIQNNCSKSSEDSNDLA